jgi:phthiocerol/phenolphthiocerol synthesis type-I polyketide synthase C
MQDDRKKTMGLPPSEPQPSLASAFAKIVREFPDRRMVMFVDDAGEKHSLTFAELDRAAGALARQLLERGKPGERVLMAFDAGLEVAIAFWAIRYAGMTAVPVDPPSANRPVDLISRLQSVSRNCGATQCIASKATIDFVQSQPVCAELFALLHWVPLSSRELLATVRTSSAEVFHPTPSDDGIAALLYTSGSTGEPKGTIRADKGFLTDVAAIARTRVGVPAAEREDVRVTWLPMTHATGFTSFLYECLQTDVDAVWLTPQAVTRSPLHWLTAISEQCASGLRVFSCAPNFALDWCASLPPEDLRQLDLSRWIRVLSVGERVRPETLRAFSDTLRACGFQPPQVSASYASSEMGMIAFAHNLGSLRLGRSALHGGVIEPAADGEVELQSSGATRPGYTVVVVDPETKKILPAGRIGEIWVMGAGGTPGYWNRPHESSEAFEARTADGTGPFFRTGDLGAFHGGELFVTGRLKAVIIIRGNKFHAEDIEATLERRFSWVRANSVIAFSEDQNGELFFVAVDASLPTTEMASAAQSIRAAIAEEFGIRVNEVLFVAPAQLPKTNTGKVARLACAKAFRAGELQLIARHGASRVRSEARAVSAYTDVMNASVAERTDLLVASIKNLLAASLQIDVAELASASSFREVGIDSRAAVSFTGELERWSGKTLPKTLLYNYPTIPDVARYLCDGEPDASAGSSRQTADDAAAQRHVPASGTSATGPIAIVGLGCRFPGAVSSLEAFWGILENGVDTITSPPEERRAYYRNAEMRDTLGGFIRDIAEFDHAYFSISKREAESMDPLQRVLLEVTIEALENAGVPSDKLRGSATGVFVGLAGSSGYGAGQRRVADAYSATGATISVTSGRLSYVLDLLGPSVTIDTACSSSLVATHLACQSLRSGESNLAIAGGISVMASLLGTVAMKAAGALAVDGRCKTFDAAANGYVRSEGCGILVLKRLDDAVLAGDRILGLIVGSATGSDGRSNGLTAPSGLAQERLIREALAAAQLRTDEVDFVEAHGTGTPLGDPIELEALGHVFSSTRSITKPLLVGSVKANLGHTEGAAGVAGIMKVLGMFRNEAIPRQIHLHHPNSAVSWSDLRIEAPRATVAWPRGGKPRVAGVSSFGFSGTLAHCIVAEPPSAPAMTETPTRKQGHDARAFLLPLSAKSPAALKAYAASFSAYLRDTRDDIGDIAFTAGVRRTHHNHRLAVVGASLAEWRESLDAYVAEQTRTGLVEGVAPEQRPRVAFVFSGQGTQWWAMGRQLLRSEPVFRAMVERCDELVRGAGGPAVLDELAREESESRVARTDVAQPALFAIQVGLVALWRAWGVLPDSVIGHSLGEIAAAHTAGILTLEQAARLVAQRGRIMQGATGLGKMASVPLPLDEAQRIARDYSGRIEVGASNSPSTTVLSGEARALAEVLEALQARNIEGKMLPVDYAFHSQQVAQFADELRRELPWLTPKSAALRMISTVTGKAEEGTFFDAEYWGREVRDPVLFSAGIEEMLRLKHTVFVEIGPHPALAAAMRETALAAGKSATIVASLRRNRDDRSTFLESLGLLHCEGVAVDWSKQHETRGRVLSLPTYPWQRDKSWIQGDPTTQRRQVHTPAGDTDAHPFLESHVELSAPARTHVWTASLDTKRFAYLADHAIQGSVLLPGAAYVEVALAAGRELLGDALDGVTDINLLQPLVLTEQKSNTIQVQVSPSGDQGGTLWTLQIASRGASPDDAASAWVIHATGTIRARGTSREQTTTDSESPTAIVRRCPETRSGKDLYDAAARAGNQFGPTFRNLQQIWRTDGEGIAQLAIATDVHDQAPEYQIHPALLDAAFQALGVAVGTPKDGSAGPSVVSGLGSIRIRGDVGASAWIHAIVGGPVPGNARAVQGDVFIVDAEGRVLVEARGLRLQRLATRAGDTVGDSLYDVTWRARALDAPAAPRERRRGVLLFLDDGGVAQRFKTLLDARADQMVPIVIVRPGSTYAKESETEFRVDPMVPEHFSRLLGEPAVAPWIGRGDLLHFWSVDARAAGQTDASSIHEALRRGPISALHLVQAVASVPGRESTRLWLVTSGAVAIENEIVSVEQAPLWGLGATIGSEYPELRCTMLDIDPRADDMVEPVLAELLLPEDKERRIALRGSSRYVQRVVRHENAALLHEREKKTLVVGKEGYRLELGAPGMVDSLTLVRTKRVVPGPDQVEVLVKATGLNFRDVLMALGAYPDTGARRLPLGGECSGIVTAVGSAVRGLREGAEVIVSGVYAFDSHMIANANLVALKPDGLSMEDAAAVSAVFGTVYYSLCEVGRLRKGETILIHSAAGGVGLAAVQYAKHVGAEILATAGTHEKRELLRGMGIRHVMSSRSVAWAEEVMEATGGRGVDVVLNSLAGEAIPKGIGVLAPFGRFLELGKRDVYSNLQVGLYAFRNNASVSVIALDQLAAERPDDYRALLTHVMELFEKKIFTPLPRETFPVSRIGDAFRHMMAGTHVGKVVVTAEAAVSVVERSAPHVIAADATYLVTGGLSGLGFAVLQWLVERGAKHVAILGRSAPSETVRARIDEMRAAGVQVEVVSADVSDALQVDSAFAHIERTLPAMRGVIHCAGSLDDATIPNLDASKFLGPVGKAKIDGGWNLHTRTKDRTLDFFLLFSSVAAPVGSPGQGNYAAANAFLDGLAHYRRTAGLPAIAVDWGPWSDTGMAARGVLGSRGLTAGLSTADGLVLLERILRDDPAQVIAVAPRFAERLTSEGALLDELGRAAKKDASSTLLRDQLQGKTPEERGELVQVVLRDLIGKLLRTEPASIDVKAEFSTLGVDSLIGIELRGRVRRQLGIDISPADVLRHSTVNSLAQFLAPKVVDDGAKEEEEGTAGILTLLKSGGPTPSLRLVCFPAAGVEPIEFRPWVRALPDAVELCAVAYPGIGARTGDPIGTLAATVGEVVAALSARPPAPLAFFGHSIGAVVAHETALELERRGITVAYAAWSAPAVVDAGGQVFSDLSVPARREGLLRFMQSIDMKTDAFVEDTELSRRFLEMFSAMLAWSRDFSVGDPLRCSTGVFYGDRDVLSTPANLDFWRQRGRSVDVQKFSGNHFYAQTEFEAIIERILARSFARAP